MPLEFIFTKLPFQNSNRFTFYSVFCDIFYRTCNFICSVSFYSLSESLNFVLFALFILICQSLFFILYFSYHLFLIVCFTVLLFLCLDPNFFSVTIVCYHQLWIWYNPLLDNWIENQRQCPEALYFYEKKMIDFNLKGQVHKG